MTYQPPNDHTAWRGPSPTQQFTYGPPPAPPRRKLGAGAIVGGATQPEANPSATAAAVAARVSPPAEPIAEPTTVAPTTEAPTATTSAAPAVPDKLVMPNLKGMNAAVADDKLRKLGFTNIQYGSQDENDTVVLLLVNWTVTKQSAKAGAELSPDDLIVVTCTKKG